MIAQSSLFSHRFHRKQVGIDTTMEANNSVFVMVNLKLFGRSSAISYRDQPAEHKISSTVHNQFTPDECTLPCLCCVFMVIIRCGFGKTCSCDCDTVGRVLHTLPEGVPVLGVTSLDNLLYLLRGARTSEQIEVYDMDSYRLLRCLTVPGLGAKADMTSCAHNSCAYISDWTNKRIHRVGLPHGADVTSWPVNDQPECLSVTDTHSVLVTCREVRKIKEFSTDGELLREIQLLQEVTSPRHTVQLSDGRFIVCHGGRRDPVHRVWSDRF